MAFACKICIAAHGLKGSDIDQLPQTEEALFAHLKDVHGITIADRESAEVNANSANRKSMSPEFEKLYESVVFAIYALMELDPAPDSTEGKLLMALATAIEIFEKGDV
jgi:hypothetical protein